MRGTEFLDRHVDNRLARFRLCFPHARAPGIEFEDRNWGQRQKLGTGYFVGRVLSMAGFSDFGRMKDGKCRCAPLTLTLSRKGRGEEGTLRPVSHI